MTSCADCHGANGQGVADSYDQPLSGDSSLEELTTLIAETMPEDDPESCVGEDAKLVAEYVYSQFYQSSGSVVELPRRRLARLTADQLRQSLADLYRHDSPPIPYTDKRGLQAKYYNREKKDGPVEFSRVDPLIAFDFGHEGPGQGINPEDYAVRWTGSLRPDETGEYEIIVRCENSFICYFGDYRRELINNHVQSAERTEFRESRFLQAGAVYPLAIQLNQRKRKTEQPPVKISLSWKTPRGVEQIVPPYALINVRSQPSFSLQTRLPADDRSYGYERGIAVDEQWNSATTTAALEFADAVIADVWPRYRRRKQNEAGDHRKVLRDFLTGLVEAAFRGPLDADLRQRYVERHLEATESDQEAIKRVLLLALKSPRFLYPLIDGHRPRSQRAGNRLALTLYDSLPNDQWLREAVAQEQLQTAEQLRTAAERMMGDWRVRAKTRAMLQAWLNWDHFQDLSKSAERHPQFTGPLEEDLRASLNLFLDDIVWSEDSDFRQLFLADWAYTTDNMAAFYGDDWLANAPAEDGLPQQAVVKAACDSEAHIGVLNHPLVMSGLAYDDASSPIHRGVFLIRYALGRTLRPPQEAFSPFSPELHPHLTTRERVSLQTGEKTCQVCHTRINSLGFTLENYDAVGRYRAQELDRPIDPTGRYTTRSGKTVELTGPRSLATFLAASEDAHRAFVRRAFQHFVKQPPAAYGVDVEDRLLEFFQANDFNIRKLIVEIAVISAAEPFVAETPIAKITH